MVPFHSQIAFARSLIRHERFKAAVMSFWLKIGNLFLGLLTTIILARILGASEFGLYTYALTLVGFLGLLANIGLPNLLVREVAKYSSLGNWIRLKDILRSANILVIVVAGVISFLAALVTIFISSGCSSNDIIVFYIAIALLPLRALASVREATLRGLHRVISGQLPESLVRPLIFLAVVVAVTVLLGERSVNAEFAMVAQVFATTLAFGVGIYLLKKVIPVELTNARGKGESYTCLIRSSAPFLFLCSVDLINSQVDILMLGWLREPSEVGIYRVVVIGSSIVLFGLSAANMVLGPMITSSYQQRDIAKLQRIVTLSARGSLFYAIPVFIVLFFFSGPLLSIFFGEEFYAGRSALVLLSAAQFINVALGSVGVILIMTGNEKYNVLAVSISASINTILNLLLIPIWGLMGAAVASSISILVWNLILMIAVHKILGISVTALGPIGSNKV